MTQREPNPGEVEAVLAVFWPDDSDDRLRRDDINWAGFIHALDAHRAARDPGEWRKMHDECSRPCGWDGRGCNICGYGGQSAAAPPAPQALQADAELVEAMFEALREQSDRTVDLSKDRTEVMVFESIDLTRLADRLSALGGNPA